ncbi:MAG TPA: serine hydrolase, partial [Thermomicrobiaceae bacterium]|nr:serine hydrolase [Thermomicrobiaceae bacterium]
MFSVLAVLLSLGCFMVPIAARNEPATVAATPSSLATLRSTLVGMLAGWSGDYAVTITDLQSGQSIDINGDRPQSSASTIKLAVLIAIAQDIAHGVRTEASVDSLVDAMMGPSDNAAARQLIIDLGNGDVYAGIARVN